MHAKSVTVSAALSIASWLQTSTAAPLVSWPGLAAAIPSWDLQSSARTGQQLETLSQVGFKTASWHHIRTSKCTLMGCLLQAGVYNETELFYSDNLRNVDQKQFSVPWIYRSEFLLEPGPRKHFWLMTHGISSRADIFLNGKRVASSSEQAGSYAGRTYDITNLTARSNALAILAYPTSYYRDFAIGWVDWNPWPADNGTGVWRDVEVKQTGPVALGPLRVVTQLGESLGSQPANVTLRARARNLEKSPLTITAAAIVALPWPSGGSGPVLWNKTFTLPPLSTADIVMDAVVERPAIWWPRQWGDQPLYTANLAVRTSDGSLSDYAAGHFGFRTVASALNANNDTLFTVNGQPFEVIGAGYAPDVFLRWDAAKAEAQLRYVLDLGFNTIRLEGKNEHPELYALADRLGVMIMPGWECCDKWEAWSYNDGLAVPTPLWTDADYTIANNSMLHEAAMMQPHPSVLAYLIGSDYWPDERATPLYLSALQSLDWHRPVIVSAASQGFSPLAGPSGMKMDGPYDWVPPNYWFATSPTPGDPSAAYRLGAAFGFNSELSPGIGTPPLSSLSRFLSRADLADLWRAPSKNLSHMAPDGSSFGSRAIYNAALFRRWDTPTSLDDYLLKAQLSDYEATRAQFEAYASRWAAEEPRPATGVIYWMLNNAWPGLHWQVWDYYLRPAGAYFGAKVGCRVEHVVYDYVRGQVYLINRSLDRAGERTVDVEVMGLDGTVLYNASVAATTSPNTSRNVTSLAAELARVVTDVVFVRLVLSDAEGGVLSRNVYWLGKELDVLDWDNSNWYVTPVTKYANFTALNRLARANVTVVAVREGYETVAVALENQSGVPAFFVSLSLVDREGRDVLPLTWEDNYVTLWPGEGLVLRARAVDAPAWKPAAVQVVGKNVERTMVRVAVL